MEINCSTKLCGLFGDPVAHSLSPAMHNAAFQAAGMNMAYFAFQIKRRDLPFAVQSIRSLGMVGVNITVPHKEEVIDYLDEITVEAEEIGAVNTILNKNGRLLGYNTDGKGFLHSLQEEVNFNCSGKRAVIIGAGGAARAVAVSLLRSGCAVTLVNRTIEKALKLQRYLKNRFDCEMDVYGLYCSTKATGGTIPSNVFRNADLIVNATPAGMQKQNFHLPIPFEILREEQVIYDLVYSPPETELLKGARMHGIKAVNGLGMLLHQGARSFELFTGMKAPVEIMREKLFGRS